MSAPCDVRKKPSGCALPLARSRPAVGGITKGSSRQPLAASPKGVKRRLRGKQPPMAKKRSQANTRVMLHGVRLSCSLEKHDELKALLAQERAKQTRWSSRAWKLKVEEIGSMDCWGALKHGGCRKGWTSAAAQPSCRAYRQESAVGDQALPIGHVGEESAVVEFDPEAFCEELAAIVVGPAALGEDGEESAVVKVEPEAMGEQLAAIVVGPAAVGEDHQHDLETLNEPSGVIVGPSAVGEDQQHDSEALPEVLPPVLTPKKRLSGYTIIEMLNCGSFGDVYKALRKDSGEVFAVKVMRKARRTARITLQQSRELSLMKAFKDQHTGIVSLQGWRETVFDIQLFMPLYDMNLRQYIKRGLVPQREGREIASQMLGAVTYLQCENILHRDIKPPNVLINRQPLAAVLGDFGSARDALPTDLLNTQDEPMTPNQVTLWYRAPEILYGKSYGLPSDIWSLGITFAELENGHAPFRQETEILMLSEIWAVLGGVHATSHKVGPAVGGQRRWGSRYGTHFEGLVSAMLVVDPRSRISANAASKNKFWLDRL